MKFAKFWILLTICLILVPATAFAQAAGSGIDWWARGASVAAITISILSLVFGRWDNWATARKTAAARLPLINVLVERNEDDDDVWNFEIRMRNQAEVPIEWLRVTASSHHLRIRGMPAESVIVIERGSIFPGDQDIIKGKIIRQPDGALYNVDLTVEYRILEAAIKTGSQTISRNLGGR
jgi:hypothetical protein